MRLKNIESKNEEQLTAIEKLGIKESVKKDRQENKKNPLIYDLKHSFEKYKLGKSNKIPSIESKFDTAEKSYRDFFKLMDLDTEAENINHENVVLNDVSTLYDNLIKEYTKVYGRESKNNKSDTLEQKYDPKNLRALEPVKLKTKSLSGENRTDIKQPTQFKQLKLNEIQKPLWIKMTRKDFDLLIKDVVDNLDNEDYKTKEGGNKYDLKNAGKLLLEIIAKKFSKDVKHANCMTG